MINYDEYRVETFRIFGLAFMTPFGKLVLDFPNLKLEGINLLSILYFVFSLVLTYIGIILVLKGFEILDNKELRK